MKRIFTCFLILFLFTHSYGQSTSWEMINPHPFPNHINSLHAISNQTVMMAGQSGMFARGTQQGDSLDFSYMKGTYNNFVEVYDIFFKDSLRAWSVNEAGVHKTNDGGATWNFLTGGNSVFAYPLKQIFFVDTLYGWMAAQGGKMYKTTDGGQNWNLQHSETSEDMLDLHMIDTLLGYAAGESGKVIKTVDSGNNWDTLSTGTQETLHACYFVNADTGWAVGNRTVLKTTNGGTSWIDQYQPTGSFNNYYYDVAFANADTGYIAGNNIDAHIGYTTDGGNSWTYINTDTLNQIDELAISENGTAWMAENNVLLRIKNLSGTLEFLTQSKTAPYQSYSFNIVEPYDSMKIYAGRGTVQFVSNDGGNTWSDTSTLVPDNSGLHQLEFLDQNIGFMLSYGDDVYKTSDGGNNWNLQGTVGIGYPDDIRFYDQNLACIFGWNGAIQQSTDGGQTWDSLTIPTTDHIIDAEFFNASEAYVTTDMDIFYTTDGGSTWTQRNKPASTWRMYDIQFLTPSTAFLAADSLYVTHDSAKTWEGLAYLYPYVKSVYFLDDSTGWFYNDNVIMSTYDGGISLNLEYYGLISVPGEMEFSDLNTGYLAGDYGMMLKASSSDLDVDTLGGGGNGQTSAEAIEKHDLNLNVYPNPATEKIRIEHSADKPLLISIYDVNGRLVKPNRMSKGNFEIEVNGLKPGNYFVRISGKSINLVKPVIIH